MLECQSSKLVMQVKILSLSFKLFMFKVLLWRNGRRGGLKIRKLRVQVPLGANFIRF
jgi:hypothetical protein